MPVTQGCNLVRGPQLGHLDNISTICALRQFAAVYVNLILKHISNRKHSELYVLHKSVLHMTGLCTGAT